VSGRRVIMVPAGLRRGDPELDDYRERLLSGDPELERIIERPIARSFKPEDRADAYVLERARDELVERWHTAGSFDALLEIRRRIHEIDSALADRAIGV
jgi:hypothetical protein